jgi:hypothetical protein
LPFDRKDRNGGKASHWVRMMQPYGGANEGMHFPLRNGTRILLGFIGGDPDRPFISGTINDSGDQQSIVTAENQSNNLIKTASGNKIELEDKEGKNRIKLQTGDNKTYMHLGAPNHDGSGFVMVTGGIERRDISGGQRVTIQTGSSSNKTSQVTKTNTTTSIASHDTLFDFKALNDHGNETVATGMTDANEVSGQYIIHRISGAQYNWNTGSQFNYFATAADGTDSSADSSADTRSSSANKHFFFGNNWEVHCSKHSDKEPTKENNVIANGPIGPERLIKTMDNFALRRVLDFNGQSLSPDSDIASDTAITSAAADEAAAAASIAANATAIAAEAAADRAKAKYDKAQAKVNAKNSRNNNTALNTAYNDYHKALNKANNERAAATSIAAVADAAKAKAERDEKEATRLALPVWNAYLAENRVRVGRHDTFNLQEGNIFDFGGYWNYNLGNSYEENTISQNDTVINRNNLPYDWCNKGGPHWTSLSPKVNENAATLAETFDKTSAPTYLAGFFNNTNVEKTIDGHAYNYSTNTHSIDVSHKCNSINVSVSGESHEVKYSGKTNTKIYESKSGGGVSEEWKSTFGGDRTEYEKVDISGKYSPGKVTETRVSTYGNPVSYEIVREPAPGSKFSFKGDAFPTLEMKMEIDVGSTVLSTHIGVMDNSIKMDATAMLNSVSIDAAIIKSSISISGCPLKTEIEIGPAGLTKFETDLPGFKLTAAMVALKMKQEAAVDMANHKVVLKNKLAEIDKGTVSLGSRACDLRNNLITLLN